MNKQKKEKRNKKHAIALYCKECGTLVKNISGEAATVLCSDCTLKRNLKKFGMPQAAMVSNQANKNKRSKPRGWHFMKVFVDIDGTVYYRGKEQPQLKGTLEPTKAEVIKKTTTKNNKKWEKFNKRNKLTKEIKQLERIIHKKHKAGNTRTKTLEKKLIAKRKKLNKIL